MVLISKAFPLCLSEQFPEIDRRRRKHRTIPKDRADRRVQLEISGSTTLLCRGPPARLGRLQAKLTYEYKTQAHRSTDVS